MAGDTILSIGTLCTIVFVCVVSLVMVRFSPKVLRWTGLAVDSYRGWRQSNKWVRFLSGLISLALKLVNAREGDSEAGLSGALRMALAGLVQVCSDVPEPPACFRAALLEREGQAFSGFVSCGYTGRELEDVVARHAPSLDESYRERKARFVPVRRGDETVGAVWPTWLTVLPVSVREESFGVLMVESSAGALKGDDLDRARDVVLMAELLLSLPLGQDS